MAPTSRPAREPSRWQSDLVGSLYTAVFWISALAAWVGAGLPRWVAAPGASEE